MLIYTILLRKGSRGNQVAQLQNSLNTLGYNVGTVDGIYGNATDRAVRSFQRANGLFVDGIVGRASIDKINELLGGKTDKPIVENKPLLNNKKSKYYKIGNAHIIETTPDNIEIKILGNTLNSAKVFGVNGSFFNTPKPALTDSCWSIATNNGKPLGGNSMLVSYNKNIQRGTFVYYKDGSMEVVRVNNINEFKKPHQWSISGYSVYPYMNFKEEQMPSGIDYLTHHTYIGYRGSQVFLIVKPTHRISGILPLVRELRLDACIVLDGGGSSQLNHPDGSFKSSRRINSAVILKEE